MSTTSTLGKGLPFARSDSATWCHRGSFAHAYSASMEGVALPRTTRPSAAADHPGRHVARHVARRAVLLVGALVFLVDDDEPHVAQGREQRAAGAYDHARLAAADEVPLVVALALPHARMHDGHQVAEAAAEARHGLGRERYLGHEHAGRAPGRQSRLDGLQVHLGLARARDAVHHHHVPARGRSRLVYDAQRLGLPGCEGGLGAGREGRRLNARRPAGRQAGGTRRPQVGGASRPALSRILRRRRSTRTTPCVSSVFERRGHRAELGGQLRHAQLARAQAPPRWTPA